MCAKPKAAIGRSASGRIQRQKILDFMHLAARPVSCREICAAVQQTRVATIARLGQMQMPKHGEIEVCEGKVGNTPTLFYTPLVRETAAILGPAKDRVKASRTTAPAESKDVTVRRPGYVRHNGMNRDHPLPRQGGQGSIGGPRLATYLEQNV